MTETIIDNRFKIKRVLGRGATGLVYQAQDIQTGKSVAIKQLKPGIITGQPEIVERFEREAEILRNLDHPNIVKMLELIRSESDYFLVMEYVAGGSLALLLEKRPQQPIDYTLELMLYLADALARTHDLGIIHRDLKPANILLTENGMPRLTDFGTAHVEQSTTLTKPGAMIGTLSYMSPEAFDNKPLDERADIWAFGVIMYEMLAGKRPFDDSNLPTLLNSIVSDTPAPLSEIRPEISKTLMGIVERMLAKNQAERTPSMRQVAAEIEAELKGHEPLPETLSIYEPTRVSFRSDAETLVATAARAHNFPTISYPFVGRIAELETIRNFILTPETRLLTLHGPGGFGKTRLATQAAVQLVENFTDGAYFVDLVAANNPTEVVGAIADALHLQFSGKESPREHLFNYLKSKRLLLLLDNFEHLQDATELVGQILQRAPHVHLLITSRRRLGLREEQVLQITGLTLPQPDGSDSEASTAVQLFLQSARRLIPQFNPTAEDMEAISRICHYVDGMPLAIELAAGWITLLQPSEIAAEITQDLNFLTAAVIDLPERHQSIRQVIDYSWSLLNENEQRTLRGLAVFRGDFSRSAANKIVGATLHMLHDLLDRSLLQRLPQPNRYAMQELLYQFAAEKLAENPYEEKEIRGRHARYYLQFLNLHTRELYGGNQPETLSKLEHRIENIRAAWHWASEQGDGNLLGLAVDGLYLFYQLRGRPRQGFDAFANAAAALIRHAPPGTVHAQLLARQGAFARHIGELEQAQSLLAKSLEVSRANNDKRETAFVLNQLGAVNPNALDAAGLWQESLALAEMVDDKALIAEALNWLAFAAYQQGDVTTAISHLQRSAHLRRSLRDSHGLAASLCNLGIIHGHSGQHNQAQQMLEESLQIYDELHDLHGVANACNNLSYIALTTANYTAARLWSKRALTNYQHIGDIRGQTIALGNLSEVAFNEGDYAQARTICLECIDLYQMLGLVPTQYKNLLGRILAALGEYHEAGQIFGELLAADTHHTLQLDVLTNVATLMDAVGERDMATSLLCFVRRQPGVEVSVDQRAAAMLDRLQPGQVDKIDHNLTSWIDISLNFLHSAPTVP